MLTSTVRGDCAVVTRCKILPALFRPSDAIILLTYSAIALRKVLYGLLFRSEFPNFLLKNVITLHRVQLLVL